MEDIPESHHERGQSGDSLGGVRPESPFSGSSGEDVAIDDLEVNVIAASMSRSSDPGRSRLKDHRRVYRTMERSQHTYVTITDRYRRFKMSSLFLFLIGSYYSMLILLNIFVGFWEIFGISRVNGIERIFILVLQCTIALLLVVEIIFRLFTQNTKYFTRRWNWFDILVLVLCICGLVAIVLFPITRNVSLVNGNMNDGYAKAFRILVDVSRVFSTVVFMKNFGLVVFRASSGKSSAFLDFVFVESAGRSAASNPGEAEPLIPAISSKAEESPWTAGADLAPEVVINSPGIPVTSSSEQMFDDSLDGVSRRDSEVWRLNPRRFISIPAFSGEMSNGDFPHEDVVEAD